MATTRLRKAFKYPEESDLDEDVDEEHQEQLIAALEAEDATKSAFYRHAFLIVPVTSALFYLFVLVFQARTARQRLICLLSLSSLGCSAYILQYLPLPSTNKSSMFSRQRVDAGKGPMEKYLIHLNAALAGILALTALATAARGVHVMRDVLPGLVLGLTLLVRQQLTPLDLEELHSARFDLRGA